MLSLRDFANAVIPLGKRLSRSFHFLPHYRGQLSRKNTTTMAIEFSNQLTDIQRSAFEQMEQSLRDPRKMSILALPVGCGKTRVALALCEQRRALGHSVLWVAKTQEQLLDAITELRRLGIDSSVPIVLRCPGGVSIIQAGTPGTPGYAFTTLVAWHSDTKANRYPYASFQRVDNQTVVWDECHFAINARMGNALLRHYLERDFRAQRRVIGLSATPVAHLGGLSKIVQGITLRDLFDTCNFYPIHRNILTNVEWTPKFQQNQVTAASLRELSSHEQRNQIIIKGIVDARREYQLSRTLVFACNQEHAEALLALASRKGIPTEITHSGRTKAEQQQAVLRFRRGKAEVLINVNQLTEGFNVPEADSVVIARPLTNQATLMQMIGRVCRPLANQQQVYVLECTDVIQRNAEHFYRSESLLNPTARTAAIASTVIVRPRPTVHIEPDVPKFMTCSFPETGPLPFCDDQTFGVELELTLPKSVPSHGMRWNSRARKILHCLRDAGLDNVDVSPRGYHDHRDLTIWRVEYDSSAGWELISPILQNEAGLQELRTAVLALDQLVTTSDWLRLNYRTGMHLTMAARLDTPKRVLGLARRVQRLEPGLFSLVSPSRLIDFSNGCYDLTRCNGYCVPLRQLPSLTGISSTRNSDKFRYHTVNLTSSRTSAGTVEVRMHNGTTSFKKIAVWLSLWMQIFNHSRYEWNGEGVYGPVYPRKNSAPSATEVAAEDIFRLLENEGIALQANLREHLFQRRLELKDNWAKVMPKRVQGWEKAGWYDERLLQRPSGLLLLNTQASPTSQLLTAQAT